jgi:hypothetical protein
MRIELGVQNTKSENNKTMKKDEQIKWRLSKLPTPEELTLLVDKKILTTNEAKNILLSSEDKKETKELEEEILFLRKLVDRLSNSQTQTIIQTIKEVEIPIYRNRDWYSPYVTWCNNGTVDLSNQLLAGTTHTIALNGGGTTTTSFVNI